MKISYLIDTDWVIDHLNKIEKVTQKLKEFRPKGMALSVISLAELYEGVYFTLLTNNRRHYEVVEGLSIFSFS